MDARSLLKIRKILEISENFDKIRKIMDLDESTVYTTETKNASLTPLYAILQEIYYK